LYFVLCIDLPLFAGSNTGYNPNIYIRIQNKAIGGIGPCANTANGFVLNPIIDVGIVPGITACEQGQINTQYKYNYNLVSFVFMCFVGCWLFFRQEWFPAQINIIIAGNVLKARQRNISLPHLFPNCLEPFVH